MSLIEVGALLYLGGEYLFHKIFDKETHPTPAQSITIPRVDGRARVPLLYGRARIRQPIIAWLGTPHSIDPHDLFSAGDINFSGVPDNIFQLYACSMLMVLCVPVEPGLGGINTIHNMWSGDVLFNQARQSVYLTPPPSYVTMDQLVGDGGFETNTRVCNLSVGYQGFGSADFAAFSAGYIEYLNGNPNQNLIDPVTGAPLTLAGRYMTVNTGNGSYEFQGDIHDGTVPGYRGYMSIFFYNDAGLGDGATRHWVLSSQPTIPSYSFEASSYVDGAKLGLEMNPSTVIFDLISTYFAKVGYGGTLLNGPSFASAFAVLQEEGNGYSRSIEDGQTALEIIVEILAQIDGLVYEDEDGIIHLKLIRPDYNLPDIFHIDPTNCEKISNLTVGSWQDVTNKVTVTYTNRVRGYVDDTVTVQNQANISGNGQSGQINEAQLTFPGCCTFDNAVAIANRELLVRSKPVSKCQAVLDRSSIRLYPGDPVVLNWPAYGISNMVFRVMNAPRGKLGSGPMTYDLISDPFYVWRGRTWYHPVGVGPVDLGPLSGG